MTALRTRLLVVLSLMLLSFPAFARDIHFAAAKTFQTGITNPKCMATGDFNHDGNADIAVINNFNNLAVFLGKGDGSFKSGQTFTLDFFVQGCIAAADFNGDHVLDLVIVGGNHGLALLTGKGDGTFNDPVYTDTQLAGASLSLVVTDLNGDGKADIFVGGNGSSEELLGDGTGHFVEGPIQPVSGFSVAAGDFNEDGKMDIVATGPFSLTISVLLGNGDGTFQAPQIYSTTTQCTGVAVGDFNGDQKLDLAVTIDSSPLIFLGNGDGTFGSPSGWFSNNTPTSIVALDFNGDGNLDLAFADFGGNKFVDLGGDQVTVEMGAGDGTFPFLNIQNVQTGHSPAWIVTADFNNDGAPDIAAANSGDGTVSVYLNEDSSRANTVTTLSSNAFESFVNQSVIFTSFVAAQNGGVPTGAVKFTISGNKPVVEPLIKGQATFDWKFVHAGTRAITASYSGDANYEPSLAFSLNQPVNPQVSTQITLGSSLNPSIVFQPVTYAAIVSSISLAPTGAVTFKISGNKPVTVPLNNGQASFTWTYLHAAPRTVKATYSGDVQHAASTTSLIQVVNTQATKTSLTSSVNPVEVNKPVMFTATIAGQNGGIPTGHVTFKISGNTPVTVPLRNRKAVFSWTFIHVAPRKVTADYSGGSNDQPSSAAPLIQNVNP